MCIFNGLLHGLDEGPPAEFFFQLLMSLLANPSRLDGCRQGAQVGLRRQVGERRARYCRQRLRRLRRPSVEPRRHDAKATLNGY
jgi:hypothetical protein